MFASSLLLCSCASFQHAIQSRPDALDEFVSDGCSLFPEGTFTRRDEWLECCIEHDLAYWQGGTRAQRLAADRRLRECVEQKTGDAALAKLMYDGVRVGGMPLYPTWYRWGYGWRYGRSYGPLSDAEQRMVAEKIKAMSAPAAPGRP